jgi:hypothetical protein
MLYADVVSIPATQLVLQRYQMCVSILRHQTKEYNGLGLLDRLTF